MNNSLQTQIVTDILYLVAPPRLQHVVAFQSVLDEPRLGALAFVLKVFDELSKSSLVYPKQTGFGFTKAALKPSLLLGIEEYLLTD